MPGEPDANVCATNRVDRCLVRPLDSTRSHKSCEGKHLYAVLIVGASLPTAPTMRIRKSSARSPDQRGVRAPIVGRCGPIGASHHRGESHLFATTDIRARLPICPVRRVALKQRAKIRATRAACVGSVLTGIKVTIHDPACSSPGAQTCCLGSSPARDRAAGQAAMPNVINPPARHSRVMRTRTPSLAFGSCATSAHRAPQRTLATQSQHTLNADKDCVVPCRAIAPGR